MVITLPGCCMKLYEMVLTCDDSLFITNCIPVKSQKKYVIGLQIHSVKRLLTGVQFNCKE